MRFHTFLCPIFLFAITQATRIMQYNVEWLFIDYYSQADCPGNGCPWKNGTAAQTHLTTISKVINSLNPDIINFCEIEGVTELQDVSKDLTKPLLPYFIQGKDTSTGENVGLLSNIIPTVPLYRTENRYNYPIPGSKCGYTGAVSSSGVSKHYITELKIVLKDTIINTALIATHLLAYPTDQTRCAEREAQAMVLQEVIQQYLDKKMEVIVLGDLNDFDGTVLDLNSNKPTSTVLEILKVNGGLTSVAEKIDQQERYTEWYDENNNCVASPNEYSMIDHILVTPLIYSRITNAFIYHGYEEKCNTYQSDHFPVIIDIE
jgi:exonuclease III